ncbi:MAG: helix-turn-helix domain-containing protein, partial [Anaerovoracaceae bacterium]
MEKNNHVQSVDRALDIIEVLAINPEGIGVTDLADSVDLHKSTVHRLLGTMAARGYVEKTETGMYKIGI